MSTQEELLDYLYSQVPQQMELSARLGGDGRVCCYYICPFSTLRKILEEGIKCRSTLSECVDLSSPDVQSRRKPVWLGRSVAPSRVYRLSNVPIHSCVNLFWNPLNLTFDAFQRNGLLRAAEKNDIEHGIICLLELDAEQLLNEDGAYWTATEGNAASNSFASFDMSRLRQFPWANTYALGPYTQENRWQPRAAELIVFLGGLGQLHTKPIPRSCFTRVLISPKVQLTAEQQEWLSNTGVPYHQVDVFKRESSLLESESLFIWNFTKYCKADKDSDTRIAAAFRILTKFESQFGGPTADRFASPGMAHGKHGIGHVTRTMFWSAFLSTYPFGQRGTRDHRAAILAAFLHDLGRKEEGKDQGHGERMLEEHRNLIAAALDEQSLQQSSVNAVQMHSVDDSKCPLECRDRLWALLKDADALERGRFRRPDNKDGCNPAMLRFEYLSHAEAARNTLPWLAYQLAGMTKHSQWDKRPCRRLLMDFFYGLGLALTHCAIPTEDYAVSQRLHQELSALLDELAIQDGCKEEVDEFVEADATYPEYSEAMEEEELLYDAEQELEWQMRLDSYENDDWNDHEPDWDDHDLDWEDIYSKDY